MLEIKRILWPTDLSKNAAEARTYAYALAQKFDAELHALHVLEAHVLMAPQFGMGLARPAEVTESSEAALQALRACFDPKRSDGLSVVYATAEGQEPVAIVRYAKEQQIDLIVMGTHGRSGLAHVLLGSVAERVLRKAPCPVLTVRPQGHEFVMP